MEIGPSAFAALEGVRGQATTAANLSRAVAAHGEDLARWAFEQWSLRKRAKAKFERAEEMLFDREGLEMATDEGLARFHATQFPSGVRVADLTVGIGADLIALAGRGLAVGFESDPRRASLARHNLAVHGLSAEILEGDCLAADWDFDYAFADPARRTDRRRSIDPDDFQPRLNDLVERMSVLKRGMIKVSPMMPDEVLKRFSKRVDFLSFRGECREAVLRVGTEAEEDENFWAGKAETGHWISGKEGELPICDEPETFLFEADPAAIRSHALDFLAAELNAAGLGDSNGYLTSASLNRNDPHIGWVRSFRVSAFGHADPKRIRAELQASNAYVKVVKSRAVREDPVQWAKKVRTEGENERILVLYPVGKSLRFVLAAAH